MRAVFDLGKYHVSCLTITLSYAQKKNVRASIQNIKSVIKSAGVPTQITQQPFDFDPKHYRQLCELGDSKPSGSDLADYALDMEYMELQPELLRYLTPILLVAWREDLFEGSVAGYAGFVEEFWLALLKGDALNKVFSKVERDAFVAYMRNSILDRLDAEELLHFSGAGAPPYSWIRQFVYYGTLFSDIEIIWNEWWHMKKPGQAIAAFQYVSVLMYEADKNPVFDPWTRDKGGGSPALWGGYIMTDDIGWKKENLDFLKAALNADYVEEKLRLALSRIENPAAKKIASGIVDDFEGQRTRLELRIEQLPYLLTDVSRVDGFTI